MNLEVANYCSAANGDKSGTGLVGQVNDVRIVACTTGYIATSNGAPTYNCTASNATGGNWVFIEGSCQLGAPQIKKLWVFSRALARPLTMGEAKGAIENIF